MYNIQDFTLCVNAYCINDTQAVTIQKLTIPSIQDALSIAYSYGWTTRQFYYDLGCHRDTLWLDAKMLGNYSIHTSLIVNYAHPDMHKHTKQRAYNNEFDNVLYNDYFNMCDMYL